MPWHAKAREKAESGHVLLALLLMEDESFLGELRSRGVERSRLEQALAARFAGKVAREQAMNAARLIREAVSAGKLDRGALIRSVLTDYWGVAGQSLREAAAASKGLAAALAEGAEDLARRPLVQLDDGSDRTIYEQIVAQVEEAIATSRLQAGDRLPTVRELADQLGIAPGTVARAYSELERQNIVVTQGVRGTRVADRARATTHPGARPDALAGLLRPAAVAAFHLGATADELRAALEDAMLDIFPRSTDPAA